MPKTKVLLVGGAGYVGSHAAAFLAEKGYEPVVLDNLVYGHREAVQWGPFEEGDIGDKDFLISVLEKHKPLAVMHFAAFAYVGESVTAPSKYYHNNVAKPLVLLDAMLACGITSFIFSSSCATYGVPTTIPITESTSQNPINPYGRTKLILEQILDDYEVAYGLRSVCLRYFNAAGADPLGRIGENHNPETHLIPLVLAAASGEGPELKVFGTDYPTPDGTCIRDYIHVTDLAQAHWQALEHLGKGKESLRLNLGNGKGYSVKEVIETVEKVTGKKVPVLYATRRAGDPPALVGSALLAKEKLQWKPQFTDLESIVKTAWDWMLRNGKPCRT